MRNFLPTYLLTFFILSATTWLIWARLDFPLTGIDDSNIFFVYAKNLANGHGFVYNASGERVEGFSSLLWTLICTAVFSISPNPELALVVVNILILSVGAAAAVSYIRSTFVSQRDSRITRYFWPLFFLFFLFTSSNYLIWNTIALMENAIWSTLLLCATIFVIRDGLSSRDIYIVFIPLTVLLLLTRPESFLWVSVFSLILLVRRILDHGKVRAFKEMLPVIVAILGTVTGLTIFRLSYFGFPLPNTYYAKVSPSVLYNLTQGTIYLLKYFVSSPIVSMGVLAAVLACLHTMLVVREKKSAEKGYLFLPFVALIGLAAPVITGGDHFSSFRFYQGVYPILLLCLIYFIKMVLPLYLPLNINFSSFRRQQSIFVIGLAVLLASTLALYQARDWMLSDEISRMTDEFEIAQDGREQGEFLREIFTSLPNLPSVGVVRAGGIKYTYPGEIIDLMGLNNLLMAHNGGARAGEKNHAAFEKETFYLLEPDIVSAEIVPAQTWQYQAKEIRNSWDNSVPLKGLYDDSGFLNDYVYAKVASKDEQKKKALVGWFREDFLDDLEASGSFVIERYEYPSV